MSGICCIKDCLRCTFRGEPLIIRCFVLPGDFHLGALKLRPMSCRTGKVKKPGPQASLQNNLGESDSCHPYTQEWGCETQAQPGRRAIRGGLAREGRDTRWWTERASPRGLGRGAPPRLGGASGKKAAGRPGRTRGRSASPGARVLRRLFAH